MLRKMMMACVAAAAIAVIAVPTDAAARGRGGGGFHGGGFHGGGASAVSMVAASAAAFIADGAAPRLGFYPYAIGYVAYGCYRTVRVFTPYGPRWRRVWVCG